MITILIFVLAITIVIATFFAYKAYKFSIIILNVELQIEESLQILNERYESMSKILEKEVFFDSVEVRQVIADIQASHSSIILIADKLAQNFEERNETKEENNQIEKKD